MPLRTRRLRGVKRNLFQIPEMLREQAVAAVQRGNTKLFYLLVLINLQLSSQWALCLSE